MRTLCSPVLLRYFLVFLALWTVAMFQQCTWTTHENTSAQGGNTPVAADNPAQCQTKCEALTGCVAVLYDSDAFMKCTLFPQEPQNVQVNSQYASRVLYRRQCVPDPTTASATTATTATMTDGCTMALQSNTTVTSHPVLSVSPSLENCQKLCASLQQCQAVSYGANTCAIHSGAFGDTTNAAGYIATNRITCSNGTSCCFGTEKQNEKFSDPSDKMLQGTEASCKEMCVSVKGCTAVTFTGGNTCNFFSGTPATSSQAGFSYFSKSCPGSASEGSVVLDMGCNSSDTIRLSKLLGVWMVCLFIALF